MFLSVNRNEFRFLSATGLPLAYAAARQRSCTERSDSDVYTADYGASELPSYIHDKTILSQHKDGAMPRSKPGKAGPLSKSSRRLRLD